MVDDGLVTKTVFGALVLLIKQSRAMGVGGGGSL